ncbi:hypothetical protein CABS02_06728 [Colletotrichum abscissum]|uniref:Uncharacterized protein n=1 Tax=Colletotrichum abscissum TaxID=1671311 RepID=A0A9Q0B2W8_9PEZI|nr:hypothetical protein CABS02_06728 [Colletotrichum abscissum]
MGLQQTASRSLPAEVLLCKPWLYLSSSPVPCLILSLSLSLSQCPKFQHCTYRLRILRLLLLLCAEEVRD